MPAAVNHDQASLSPNSGRERFECVPSLANEIDDRPALLSTLQALQLQFPKLAAAQSATEQDGQDRSITLSGQSLSIGYLMIAALHCGAS
jgi:hypothetical protein